MGCACLRGDGHRRAVRGAGRAAIGRQQQSSVTHQPDAAGSHAGAQFLRGGGDANTVRIRKRVAKPDPVSDANAVGVGKPVGDRDRQRLGDPLPLTVSDGITVAERQRETLDLALGPL